MNLQEEFENMERMGNPRLLKNALIDKAFDCSDLDLMERVNLWCRTPAADWRPLATQLEKSAGNGGFSIPEALLIMASASKSYTKGHFNLSQISLTIHAGETIGVVGENGNGKTTLLNLAAGILNPDAGTVTYPFLAHGHSYYQIRQHIGYIPQRIPRWYGVLKNSLHFSASCNGIFGRENEIKVEQMLHRLDLWKFANHTWNQISSGYKTRFEIARILINRPRLLILDEPLSNLDINTQQMILTDLRNLAKSAKAPMGILMSSQQLHEIEKASDNILFLKNGTCTFQSKTSEVLAGTVLEIDFAAGVSPDFSELKSLGFGIRNVNDYYEISHPEPHKSGVVLSLFTQKSVGIKYFRDISNSAKRLFN